jgi:hypothetical protein
MYKEIRKMLFRAQKKKKIIIKVFVKQSFMGELCQCSTPLKYDGQDKKIQPFCTNLSA